MEVLFKQAAGLLTDQDREVASAIVAEASAGPPDLVAPVLVNELAMGGIDVPASAAAHSYAQVAPEDVLGSSLEQIIEGGRGLNPSSPSGTARVLGTVADTLDAAMGEFSSGISSALGSGWQGEFADQALHSVGRYARSGTALADELRSVASKSSSLAGGYETTRADVEKFTGSHMAGLREGDFRPWAAHLVNVNYNPHLIDANLSGASFTAAYPVVVGGAGGASGIAELNSAGATAVSGLAETGSPRVQAAVEGVGTPFRTPATFSGGVDAETTSALRGGGAAGGFGAGVGAAGAGGVGTASAGAQAGAPMALDGSRGQMATGAGATPGIVSGAGVGATAGAGGVTGTGAVGRQGVNPAVRPATATPSVRAGAGAPGTAMIGPGGVVRGGNGGPTGGRARGDGFGAAGSSLGAGGGLVGAGTLAGGAAGAVGQGQNQGLGLGGMRGPTGLVTPPMGGFGAGGVGAGAGAGGAPGAIGPGGGSGAGAGGVGIGSGTGGGGAGASAGGGAGGPGGAGAGASSHRGIGPMGMMPAGAMGAGHGDRRGTGVPSYLVDATNTSELLGTAPKVSPGVIIGRQAAAGQANAAQGAAKEVTPRT